MNAKNTARAGDGRSGRLRERLGIDLLPRERRARWLLAVLLAALALALRLGLADALPPYGFPFLTFFPAVALATLYGGLGPGLACVGLSSLAAKLYFIPEAGSLLPASSADTLALGFFTGIELLEVVIIDAMQRAIGRAHSAHARSEALASALHDNAALLDTVLQALPVGVIIADAQGRIVRDNAAHRALWGGPPDTTAWQQYGDWVGWNPDTGERIRSEQWALARALNRGVVVRDELVEIQPFDGSRRRFYLNNAAPIRDARGRLSGGVVVELDVTERREAALAQARLAAVVDATPDAVISFRAEDGRIMSWNRGAETLFGWTEAQALGGPVSLMLPDRLPEGEPTGVFRWALDGKRVQDHETLRRTRSGEVIPVAVTAGRMVSADGRVIGVSAIFRDLRPRRAAEAARRASEERLQQLLATLQLSTVFVRAMDGTIRFWSDGCARLYGWSAQEAVGRNAHQLLQTVFPVPLAQIQAAIERDGEWAGDLRHRTRDGAELVISVRKMLRRDADGQPIEIAESLTDVTAERHAEALLARGREELERLVELRTAALIRAAEEQRRAEAAVRQSEKLAALGQLTGGIAHDFNNMMQVVTSGAALLKSRDANLDGAQRARILEGLMRAGDNARELTGRLLAFARRQSLHPEPLDVDARLRGIAGMLRKTLGSRIRIVTDVEPGLWPVHADASQLEVAIVNLALNARDAMPEGGTMTLQARNLVLPEADERPAGDYVCIAVRDGGVGIPAHVLGRIFEPFFTTKGLGKGTGLGLSQVLGFAKQSGGDVKIDSRPGQGTTVCLHLPRSTVPVPVGAPAPGHADGAVADAVAVGDAHVPGRTVLVVEDNPEVAAFASALLEERGYAVRCAGDADAALALLHAPDGAGVDAVFSDVVMPGSMSGVGLAAALRETRPRLPVVLATGYSEQVALSQVPAGIDVLGKPYRPDEVASALERAFERIRGNAAGVR